MAELRSAQWYSGANRTDRGEYQYRRPPSSRSARWRPQRRSRGCTCWPCTAATGAPGTGCRQVAGAPVGSRLW